MGKEEAPLMSFTLDIHSDTDLGPDEEVERMVREVNSQLGRVAANLEDYLHQQGLGFAVSVGPAPGDWLIRAVLPEA